MKFNSIQKIQFYFIFILSVLNFIQAFTLPLIDDEAYYWVWSKFLDFGYYDHPPMVALFDRLGYFIFPNELGVRLLAIVSNTLIFLSWIQILRPKTQKENYLFLGLFGSVGIFQGLGFISTPDTPLLLFGSFFLWRWKSFLENQNLKNALLLGLSMTLTMYSKYHGAILISLAFLPSIKILYKNKWFYVALLLSLILYSPHLYWQYNHNWPSVRYHLYGRNQKEITGFPFGEWLLGLLVIANPLLLYFYGKSIFKSSDFKDKWTLSLKWISAGSILFFGLCAITRNVQPQWNLIIYVALIPLTFLFYRNRLHFWVTRLSFIYIGLLVLARILLFFPLFISYTPMYKLKQFVLNAHEVNTGIAVFERYQKTALYNFYTQEPSICLQVYTHRESQYDLWNSEKSIQRQTITFFGLESISSDFIMDENNKKEFYKTIDDFHSYPKIKCEITPVSFSAEESSYQTMDIKWNNPHDEDLTLKSGSSLEAGIIFVNSKSLEPIVFIPFSEPIEIPANSDFEKTLSITIPVLPTGTYKSYVAIKPFGISGKIVSNEMTTVVQ